MIQGFCSRTGEPATCGCPCSECSEWIRACSEQKRKAGTKEIMYLTRNSRLVRWSMFAAGLKVS